jgi:hypothetical protein
MHLLHLHRTLHHLLHSELAFLGLVRAGLIHLLFDALMQRLREEDESWSLAFELEEEQREAHESVEHTMLIIRGR